MNIDLTPLEIAICFASLGLARNALKDVSEPEFMASFDTAEAKFIAARAAFEIIERDDFERDLKIARAAYNRNA